MTEKRINLCFNVDDKRQEIVYDFLMEKGKKKTATVIDLVMAYLSGQSDRKNPAPNIGADIAEQVERVIKENSNRTETEKIQRSLDKILTLLESGVIINSSQGDENSVVKSRRNRRIGGLAFCVSDSRKRSKSRTPRRICGLGSLEASMAV